MTYNSTSKSFAIATYILSFHPCLEAYPFLLTLAKKSKWCNSSYMVVNNCNITCLYKTNHNAKSCSSSRTFLLISFAKEHLIIQSIFFAQTRKLVHKQFCQPPAIKYYFSSLFYPNHKKFAFKKLIT